MFKRLFLMVMLVLVFFFVSCTQGETETNEPVVIKIGEIGANGEAEVSITIVSPSTGTAYVELYLLPTNAGSVEEGSWAIKVEEGMEIKLQTAATFTLLGLSRLKVDFLDPSGDTHPDQIRVVRTQNGGTPFYGGTPVPTKESPEVAGSVEVTFADPFFLTKH